MTDTRNLIIAVLAIAVAALGYLFYQSRQNVVEIKLPSVSIQKQ
jgi:hypothetical protein